MSDERDQKIFAWREEGKTFAWIATQLGISRPMVAYLYYRLPGAKTTQQIRGKARRFDQVNSFLHQYAQTAREWARRLAADTSQFDSPRVVPATEWGSEHGYPEAVIASIAEGTRSVAVIDAAREARNAYLAWKTEAIMHPALPGEWLEEQSDRCGYVPAIVLRRRRKFGLRCAPSKEGTRLRACLAKAGLKASDMAAQFNVHPCYVSQWLSGCSPVPQRVAAYLNRVAGF